MKLKVKLFASLSRGRLSGTPFEVELPDGKTLADLVQILELPVDEVKICFINGRICELDNLLMDGDEVGIFPPVGGG